mgnify:CR=1 FL=1
MTKIVGIRFRNVGKIYYFDPKNYKMKILTLKNHYKIILNLDFSSKTDMISLYHFQ